MVLLCNVLERKEKNVSPPPHGSSFIEDIFSNSGNPMNYIYKLMLKIFYYTNGNNDF